MPKLSEKTQAARRARILDAAEGCFARSGFHGATMQEICRAAGISAGALYVYFRSKEELIEGLSLRDRARVREAFAQAGAGGDVVRGMVEVLTSCVLAETVEKARLFVEMGAEATRNPAVATTMRGCDLDVRGALEETLRRAAALGQIAPSLPIPDVVALMAVTVDGLFWRRATDPGFDPAAIAPHVVRMFATTMGVSPEALAALAQAEPQTLVPETLVPETLAPETLAPAERPLAEAKPPERKARKSKSETRVARQSEPFAPSARLEVAR
jgi:AcrR family transcriptional regulator